MVSALDRRVSALEAASGVNTEYYFTLIIFEDDGAQAEVARNWGANYLRKRGNDESTAQFEQRVSEETKKLGPKVSTMTRARYDEIAAQLDKET